MDAAIDQHLQRQELAGRFRHLAAAIDEEIVVHPDARAGEARLRRIAAAMRLVLGDLIGVMHLAVVDAASVDVERMAQLLKAHDRAFKMPAGRAAAPG